MMEMLTLRIDSKVKRLLKMMSKELGLTPSEYIRQLIYKDLDRHNILTTEIEKLKEEMKDE